MTAGAIERHIAPPEVDSKGVMKAMSVKPRQELQTGIK
jgi:hypothetical protein